MTEPATPGPARLLAIGANVSPGGTAFCVWAPEVEQVLVRLEGAMRGAPDLQPGDHVMTRDIDGYHTALVPEARAGTLYRYLLDGRGPFPDPASRWQPRGVHGPSAVVDPEAFTWTDAGWTGLPLDRTVFYELHVGTFTPEGTFEAAAARLPYLADLGITAVLVMPVADFPGARNWGYDGVAPFAPARCYGSPDDFRRFVDAAHALTLAVHLDVVYNHFGPDGAYQSTFSRFYYSTSHQNPWGASINYDGPHSAPVRAYVIENARRWIREYHLDGLRLDATHAIHDDGPAHLLKEVANSARLAAVPARPVQVIAEDDRNLNVMIRPTHEGGWGLDGVWADDFHHHLRRALAGDTDGYFSDFDGSAAHIALTARQGWFFTGQHSAYRGGPRGTSSDGLRPEQCVICLQNHDQVGNRAYGDRLHHHLAAAAWRAASTLLLTLPETPLLFMGQEWAASSPFLYFTDHEPGLGRLVTEGRRHEFSRFNAFADPVTRAHIPDPQQAATFEHSRLDWSERHRDPHAPVWRLYHNLLRLRRSPVLSCPDATVFDVQAAGPDVVVVLRGSAEGRWLVVVRLRGSGAVTLDRAMAHLAHDRMWEQRFTTEDASYAADPQPQTIDLDALTVSFVRPGAVIMESGPRRMEGSR